MDNQTAFIAPHQPKQFAHPGYLPGLSFGDFFDGIQLHQVLQWHHRPAGCSAWRRP